MQLNSIVFSLDVGIGELFDDSKISFSREFYCHSVYGYYEYVLYLKIKVNE